VNDNSKTLNSSDTRINGVVIKHVARITIDRAEKMNSLDASMVTALGELCQQLERDDSIRVVILTGAGSKSFCAGGDIDAWSGESAEAFGRFWIREGHLVFEQIARLRQPVIAVLNGHTLGGGLELAACADYRIAEFHVKVGQPETGIGIIPGWSGTQRVVRRFGAGLARRMALFGEVYTAERALELGLVDQVCSPGEGMAAADTIAQAVAARSPRATELTKMLINSAEGEEGGRVIEALAGAIAADSTELVEGLSAYREKRKPDFG